jgi:hypothetical protein
MTKDSMHVIILGNAMSGKEELQEALTTLKPMKRDTPILFHSLAEPFFLTKGMPGNIDAAIYVVDPAQPIDNTWIDLIHFLGIDKVIAVVSKMDRFQYCQHVYTKVEATVCPGLNPLFCIPITLTDNIQEDSRRMCWYNGPTLVQALSNIEEQQEEGREERIWVQKQMQSVSNNNMYECVIAGGCPKGYVGMPIVTCTPSCTHFTTGQLLGKGYGIHHSDTIHAELFYLYPEDMYLPEQVFTLMLGTQSIPVVLQEGQSHEGQGVCRVYVKASGPVYYDCQMCASFALYKDDTCIALGKAIG